MGADGGIIDQLEDRINEHRIDLESIPNDQLIQLAIFKTLDAIWLELYEQSRAEPQQVGSST